MATQIENRKSEADVQKELAALRTELTNLKDELARVAEAGKSRLKDGAAGAYDAAKDVTQAARQKLMEEGEALLAKLREGAAGTAETIKEQGAKAIGTVEHTIEERPVTAMLTALGVGFALGWLTTKSR